MSAAGYSHLMSWISSSVAEAARLHHREVGADHLLLGLIAQGGRAAQGLGCHGVSLATARQALAEVSRGDLAGISIDPATVPCPPHSPRARFSPTSTTARSRWVRGSGAW